MIHSFPSWLVWGRNPVVLSKWPINQFELVQQRKEPIQKRAYCPNIYTVVQGEGDQLDQDLEENQSEKNVKYRDLRKREEAMDQVNQAEFYK